MNPQAILCFVLGVVAMPGLVRAAERPNLLLLFADDLGRHVSLHADPACPSPEDGVSTPVIDRLAAEGACFPQAFVSAPSCTPSRGSLYTGRHFFRNGSVSQLHSRWAGGLPDPAAALVGMPATLGRAGYHIGWSHKWHIPERWIGGRKNHYAPAGQRINQFSGNVSRDPAARAEIFREVRDNFRAFLAKKQEGQPFFYSFNPTNTHRPWQRGSGKALWGIDPDSLQGRLPPFLPDHEVVREDFADYLGEVMAFDAACGVILDELAARGELDRTLVVVTGDHGAPGFPRGKCNVHDFGSRVPLVLRWPGKIEAGRVVETPVSLIDLAPTFLAAAGVVSEDDPDGQDLLPALRAGSKARLRGWALIGREVHVSGAREGHLPYPVRALRTAEHLYVRNFKPERWPMGDPKAAAGSAMPAAADLEPNTRAAFADIDASPTKTWLIRNRFDEGLAEVIRHAWRKRPVEELYCLADDPHQLRNLAAEPAHAGTLAELRARLMAELEAKRDPRLDDAFDRAPYLDASRD